MQQLIEEAMRAAGRLGINPLRAVTLIGMSALAEPDPLVEDEAVAVLDSVGRLRSPRSGTAQR